MEKYCCNKNDVNLPLLADFLRVISEENRLRIICFLQKSNEQCVCEIQEFLGLPQNLVSHHLKILRDFGVLNHRKQGLNVFYSIDQGEMTKYGGLLEQIIKMKGDI